MKTTGSKGWIILATFIYLWDRFANETLSFALWRALRHPVKRFPVIAVWGVITIHLFRPLLRVPPKYDLVNYLP